MVSLFLISRHVAGKREKPVSADTAYLDSAVVSSALTVCLPNPKKLRERHQ